MTKRDYEIIAAAVFRATENPVARTNANNAFNHVVNQLVLALEKDNSRFNRGAFARACLLGE